jgi:hypothetical protein
VTETIARIDIPDSQMVRGATELVGAATDDLLFNHSRRAHLWSMLHTRDRRLTPDPELVYVGPMFRDLGLTPKYLSVDHRF